MSTMSRIPRTTKRQKEILINHLENHKILLGGKFNPINLPQINRQWEELAILLNRVGPCKTVRQWKDAISDMKSNAKRKARDIKYGQRGTGGGPAIKNLNDFEERLLALISKLTIEGVDLVEPGIQTEFVAHPTQSATEDFVVVLNTVHDEEMTIADPSRNEVMESIYVESPVEVDENREPLHEVQLSSTGKLPHREKRPVKKKGDRVTSALHSHDKVLKMLSESNIAMARSTMSLAKGINNIAKAINNLARSQMKKFN